MKPNMALRNGVTLVFSLTRNTSVAKYLPTMYGEQLYRNTQKDLSVLFKNFAHFLGGV